MFRKKKRLEILPFSAYALYVKGQNFPQISRIFAGCPIAVGISLHESVADDIMPQSHWLNILFLMNIHRVKAFLSMKGTTKRSAGHGK